VIPATLLERASRRLVTVDRSARLVDAAQAFDRPETLLIIVCDESGVLRGVVSRTDIVARISHCTGCSCTESVQAAMTAEVESCTPSESLDDIWARMKRTGFMHLPVVDGAGGPLGVLAARDVLVALLADREHEETLLMDYVTGIGYR
jgi:CBS domain-containing protein